MTHIWTTLAIVVGSLGHLIGFDVGILWSLAVTGLLMLAIGYYKVKPGMQAMQRISWGQIALVLLGATVLGLILRWLAFGTVNILFNLLPA